MLNVLCVVPLGVSRRLHTRKELGPHGSDPANMVQGGLSVPAHGSGVHAVAAASLVSSERPPDVVGVRRSASWTRPSRQLPVGATSTKKIYSLECGGAAGAPASVFCLASRRSLNAFSAVTISSRAGHPYLEKRSR